MFHCTKFKKKPGHESGHTMCLWNGFLMSAPGHPILAKVIETVVNNVRNRFTSLDVMNTLCPNVHFSVGFKFKVLFTSKSYFFLFVLNIYISSFGNSNSSYSIMTKLVLVY
jgi:hypothetical protein